MTVLLSFTCKEKMMNKMNGLQKKVVQGGKVGGPDDPNLPALMRLRMRLEAEGKSFPDVGTPDRMFEVGKNDGPNGHYNRFVSLAKPVQ